MIGIRVLVADDHTLVRQGLVRILADDPGVRVVAEAGDGLEAVEMALKMRPDVVVMDVAMPRLSGIEAVRRIRQELPSARILALTVHDEEDYVLPMVQAGATGYLVKDSAASELITAIRTLRNGQGYFGPSAARVLAERYRHSQSDTVDPYGTLTPREREVFHLVVEGKTTKELAKQLGITVKTAENHRARLMFKLGVHNTAELVRYAARKGLLT